MRFARTIKTVWYGGLDLAFTRDMCAYVRVGWQDGELHAIPRFWMPGEGLRERERIDRNPYTRWAKEGILEAVPGGTVDFALVAGEILRDIQEKTGNPNCIRSIWHGCIRTRHVGSGREETRF